MFGRKRNDESPLMMDEITEEALGLVVGGATTADAEPAPTAPTAKCKPGEASCTDSTHPWGDW